MTVEELADRLMSEQIRKRQKMLKSDSLTEFTKARQETLTKLRREHFLEIAEKVLHKEEQKSTKVVFEEPLMNIDSWGEYAEYKFKSS